MTEYEELFKNFSKLGLDEKRNKYSEEVIKVALLLKSFLSQRKLELIDMPYNYKSGEDKKTIEMILQMSVVNQNTEEVSSSIKR